MLFPKLVFAVFSVAIAQTLVVAVPQVTPPVTPPTSLQCCSSVVDSSSLPAFRVALTLGLDLSGLNIPVGLSCSHIFIWGQNCGGTTVICDAPEAEWGGLIAINCIPFIQ